MVAIDKLALSKKKQINGTSQDWLMLTSWKTERDRLFKKFANSCLNADKDNYK